MKTLSVITPVYNRADCIGRCMNSVASQNIPSGWTIEHIITDDGSTDATVEVIRKKASPHVRLKILPENRGTNAARNAAAALASGEWIVILDSDDEMLPGAVQAICNAIDLHPDFEHFVFDTDDTAYMRTDMADEEIFTYTDFLLERVCGDFVHVLRRQTMIDIPFDEKLRIHEGIFILQFYRKAKKVLYTSKVIYHRDRERNDHVTFELDMTTDRALLTKLEANRLWVKLFAEDYKQSPEGRHILLSKMLNIYKFAVLSGDYAMADAVASQIYPPLPYSMVRRMHMGPAAWFLIKNIVKLKHRYERR